jgi:hypothetical protein
VSLKLQPISYEAPLLHKLLNELFFIEIRPVTAELLSVLCLVPFHSIVRAGWSVCSNTYLSLLAACGGGVGRREKISTGLGQILLTLPAATEYIPTGEGQI